MGFSEGVFTHIYTSGRWKGKESPSGAGSDTENSALILQQLESLLRSHNIQSVLDIPCGDFNWMKEIQLGTVQYLGADIVRVLVDRNVELYGNSQRQFMHLDLSVGPLPSVDLIFTRDLFLHLPLDTIQKCIRNVLSSDARYWLVSTSTSRVPNADIPTGLDRKINLCREPFGFPEPLLRLEDGASDHNRGSSGRSMGLWQLSTLRDSLERR